MFCERRGAACGRGRQSVSFPTFCAHYPGPHPSPPRPRPSPPRHSAPATTTNATINCADGRQNTTLTARGKYEEEMAKNMHQRNTNFSTGHPIVSVLVSKMKFQNSTSFPKPWIFTQIVVASGKPMGSEKPEKLPLIGLQHPRYFTFYEAAGRTKW